VAVKFNNEDFVILACTVLTQSQSVTGTRTHGRFDDSYMTREVFLCCSLSRTKTVAVTLTQTNRGSILLVFC